MLAAWMCFKPLSLGPEPKRDMMSIGAKIARTGKGLDRLLLEDRQVVGRWVKTFCPKDSEDVVWLSPDLEARWLGYLQESENLTNSEVETRWATLSKSQGRNLWFIVRLAALDKQDPLEMGMEEPAQTADLEPLAIRATLTDLSGNRVALTPKQTKVLASIRSSDANEVIGIPWYVYSDAFKPLCPAVPPEQIPSDLGTNEAKCLLVEMVVPDDVVAAREVEVRVLSRRKTRIARFATLRLSSTQLKSQYANRNVQRSLGSG